ncbi:MAG: NAD-dependent epimerase/dehydratase family protein [Rhodocyclaceae bacterium]|nr:NAD-dependent epimerase/dehydratase family protein [Rhodocyclaceae bacterium]
MTRVMLTGATGFVGRCLAPALRKSGHEVFEANSQSGDVADDTTWSKFPRAEALIHLAGKTFVPDSWADPSAFIKCNLLGTVAALNYCRRHNARMVFLSSYLYGNPRSLPIPETAILSASNPYALSKKLAEEVCQFYSDKFAIDVTVIRPFNVYGPGQSADFLIPSIIRQVRTGKAIEVKDLAPRRDYVYVGDVVDAIVKTLALDKGSNIFNVGLGRSYSVAEVIEIVQGILGTNLPIVSSNERRQDEIMDTVADISHASNRLGWQPMVSLENGLRSVIDTLADSASH